MFSSINAAVSIIECICMCPGVFAPFGDLNFWVFGELSADEIFTSGAILSAFGKSFELISVDLRFASYLTDSWERAEPSKKETAL